MTPLQAESGVVFRIITPEQEYRIFADGTVSGFGPGTMIINYLGAFIASEVHEYARRRPCRLSLSEALEEAYSRTCEAEYSTTTDTRDALPCGNKIEASQDPEVTTCKDCEDSVVL